VSTCVIAYIIFVTVFTVLLLLCGEIKLRLTAYCREMFQFDLPSAILKKRSEKFDSISFN